MKAIQITIDESTLREIDRRLRGKQRHRSAFIRAAVHRHLEHLRIRELERQEVEAYRRKPVRPGEFDVWDRVQAWPDE